MEHYTIKYQMAFRINRHKKATPDNIKLRWVDAEEEFLSYQKAKEYIDFEKLDTYKIYRVELVENNKT